MENRQGLFIFLDMEKAFDKGSFTFQRDGRTALNFGPYFRKWIDVLYDHGSPYSVV